MAFLRRQNASRKLAKELRERALKGMLCHERGENIFNIVPHKTCRESGANMIRDKTSDMYATAWRKLRERSRTPTYIDLQ